MIGASSYLKALYRRFRLLGAWPPNQRVEVGEIGVLERGAFRRVSTLHHLKIPFQVVSSSQQGALEYSEESELDVLTDAGAAARLGRDAPELELRVRFPKEGGFLFSAEGVVEWRVEDSLSIEQAVLRLAAQDRWDPQWVIVDRVLQAESLTTLIAETAGAEIGLVGKASARTGPLRLADAGLGLNVRHARGQTLRFLGERGLTPLFQALRLDRGLFQRDRLESAPLRFSGDEGGLQEVVPDFDAPEEPAAPGP